MKNIFSKLIIAGYAIGFLWWAEFRLAGNADTLESYYWGVIIFGCLPVLSGIYGMHLSRGWGGIKSVFGRAIFFLSAGLSLWGVGSWVFAYYNIVQAVSVPFPSFADAVYIGGVILWVVSIIYFAKAAGAKYGLRDLSKHPMWVLTPIVLLVISYYFIVTVARGGVLFEEGSDMWAILFSLAYPFSDIVLLTIALTSYNLIHKFLGGLFKNTIRLTFFGFVMIYIADVAYSYTVNQETFYVGCWVDVLYLSTITIMSIAMTGFNRDRLESDQKSAQKTQ